MHHLSALVFLACACPVALASSSYLGYSSLKVAEHPDHELLWKHNEVGTDSAAALDQVCVGATAGYTGYLKAQEKHFYFAFFESRSKPASDPLVLWTNGGPGCSSLLGLLEEHGPCLLTKDGKSTYKNEYSWINTANVIYFEQPLGVGFSFDATPGARPTNSSLIAADDLIAFMKLWYAQFPEHKKQDFHLSGESYAGRYLPVFANAVVNHNEASSSDDQIPLKSVIIGNGQYNLAVQELTYWNMTCTDANWSGPLLDHVACEKIRVALPQCGSLYQKCQVTHNTTNCTAALDYCSPLTQEAYRSTNHSLYDVREKCSDSGNCQAFEDRPAKFLNRPEVRRAFGADDRSVRVWQTCNDTVNGAFWDAMDPFYPSATYLAKLLDKGLPFFIYHGIYDVSCNYLGAEQVLNNLAWRKSAAFLEASWHPIKWSGGEFWEVDNFRYSRVNGAGHFVPMDQPAAGLELLQSWLEKRQLK